MKKAFLLIIFCFGCARNPVTGQKELSLISESQEAYIGASSYTTMVQAQGGPFTADPELVAYVQTIGAKLVAQSHRPQLGFEFVIVNDSVPNAWALPGGKIAINRGLLLELSSEAELAAVLGHEITHAAARHGAKSLERGMFLQGSVVALGFLTRKNSYNDILVNSAGVGAALVQQKYSRSHELEADRFGMEYMLKAGYDPAAAVTLQETFLRLSEDKKSMWVENLFASHPPSQDRIEANKETLKSLQIPESVFVGKDEYQAKIAKLIENKQAYEETEKAAKALQKKELSKAKVHIQKALSMYPQEAKFWIVQGDIYAHEKRPKEARDAYTRAIEQNGSYYLGYLQRAKINNGKLDVERSLELLSTGDGHEFLGTLFAKEGDLVSARTHYEMASHAESEAGVRARKKLSKLVPTLQDVSLKTKMDGKKLHCTIENHSPRQIRTLTLDIRQGDKNYTLPLDEPIEAYQKRKVSIELSSKKKVDVTITSLT